MPTNRQFFDQGLDAFSMPSTAPASWATGRSSTELGSSSLNFSVRRSREPSSESERSSLSTEEPVRPSTFSKGKRKRFRASSDKDDKEISPAIVRTDESYQEHQEPPTREEHLSTDFLSSLKAAHSIKQSTSEHCFETGMELPLSEPTTTENPEPVEELPDTKPFRLLRKPSKDDLSKLHLRLSLAETGPKIQAQPLPPLRIAGKSDSDASTSLQLRLPDSTQLSSPSELSMPHQKSGRQPLSHREHLPEIQSALQQLLHHFNGPKEFWHTPANRRRQQLMRQELSQIKSLLKQLLTEVSRSQPRCFRNQCSCPEQANLKTWLQQLLPPLRHCRVLASSRQLTSTIDDLINHLRDYQRKSTESASTSEESYGFQNYLEQLQNLRKACKLSVRGHRVEILQQRLKLQVILRQLLKDALDQLAKILIILPK